MPRLLFIATVLWMLRIVGAADRVHWSKPDTDDTPQGNVHFHGPFGRENIDVSCEPGKHDFIRISFDLLIMHTWDGSWTLGADGLPVELGPDTFRLGVKGGPTLIYATFSNVPYVNESRFQNFPSPVPGDQMPAQSGAKETDTHGYLFPTFVTNPPIKQDSTYHIEFVVPHHDAQAIVQMQGINLQDLLNESWGVSDFRIVPLNADQVKSPTLDALGAAFDEALRADSDKRMEAFAKLVTGMDTTTTWLQINVSSMPIDAQKVARLVTNLSLDDAQRESRDAAMQELLQLGPQVEVFLRDARNVAPAEGRCRIDMLLQSISVTPINDENLRRVMLATRLLEIIRTPAAMELRQKLVSP